MVSNICFGLICAVECSLYRQLFYSIHWESFFFLSFLCVALTSVRLQCSLQNYNSWREWIHTRDWMVKVVWEKWSWVEQVSCCRETTWLLWFKKWTWEWLGGVEKRWKLVMRYLYGPLCCFFFAKSGLSGQLPGFLVYRVLTLTRRRWVARGNRKEGSERKL